MQAGLQMLGWSQTQSEDVQADVEQGSAITDEIANETLDAMEGDFGEDAEDDEAAATVIAQDLLERSAALADTEDGADIAAAVLVSGVQILNDMADQAHPEAQEAVRAASAEVRARIARTPPSTVKSAFEGGFRPEADATPRPGGDRVDGLAHPHVATAEAQHEEARAAEP